MLPRLNNSCSPDAQYGDVEGQLSAFQKVPGKCSRHSAEETGRNFTTSISALAQLELFIKK